MDGTATWQEDRATLMRVVALLHALAGLAGAAAGRSPAVRGLALWFLRHAEAVTRDFVAGALAMPHARDCCPTAAGPTGTAGPIGTAATGTAATGPAEAIRLAGAFRALAVLLQAFIGSMVVADDGRVGRRGRDDPGARRAEARRLAALAEVLSRACAAQHRVAAPDTS